MPDQRHHRGPHPEDGELFSASAVPRLAAAVGDLSWLLTRDYATPGALKLVGDRYGLNERQRTAAMRCACSDQALATRQVKQATAAGVSGQTLLLDGYNILTTIEAALAGGVILHARDGCYRDMASMHGTYRKVEETSPAIRLIGGMLQQGRVGPCVWYLDSPVSNSGRLKGIIAGIAADEHWDWRIEIVQNPDPILSASGQIVATADSVILDRCTRWLNLAREIVACSIPQAHVADLSHPGGECKQ
jgi:hypothetical protein